MTEWKAPVADAWRQPLRTVGRSRFAPSSTAPAPTAMRAAACGYCGFEGWSFAALAEAFGSLRCHAHPSRDRSRLTGTTIGDVIAGRAEDACLASVRLTGEAGAAIARRYTAPPSVWNILDEIADISVVPTLKWLVVGRRGAVNRLHADIWDSAAWNVLLYGRKTWLLTPPDWAPGGRSFSCTQTVGDVLFVPSGWRHEVLYDSDAVAITENYADLDNASIVSRAMKADGQPGLAVLVERLEVMIRRRMTADGNA